jgi:threonine dehydratase
MTSPPDSSALCADIESALPRVHQYSSATPLLKVAWLDQLIDGEVLLKAECLQPTGSFKIRGALNAMTVLTEKDATDLVVAFSSGNHGIGVAYAARCLGKTATIVVPNDAPRVKIERIRQLGAEIIFYDRQREDREQIANALLSNSPATLIKPYDDWHTIAGQGTCGVEIEKQDAGKLDSVIVCAGGGGFVAGVGTYLRSRQPSLQVYTAEPEGWADHQHSFAAGERLALTETTPTLCDALMAPEPGALTFSINALNATQGLATSDQWVVTAMQLVWRHLGLRLEPSGAVGLACLMASPLQFQGQRVVVTLSGGNIDPPLFSSLIDSARETA